MNSRGRKQAGRDPQVERFAPMRQQRGRQLHSAGHVRGVDDNGPDEIMGSVVDAGRLHTAYLMFDERNRLTTDCTCRGPAFCEHAFALLLAFGEELEEMEREKAVGGSDVAMTSRAPRSKATPAPQRRRKTTKVAAAVPPGHVPAEVTSPPSEWRTRMVPILDGAVRIAGTAEREVKLLPVYFVDLQATRSNGRLEFHIMTLRRTKQATLLDPIGTGTDPATLPEIDRHLFRMLRAEDDFFGGPVPRSPVRIERKWAGIVVPLLFATGRVHLTPAMGSAELASAPLRFDDGPAFTFASEMRCSAEGTEVHGRIHRAGEERRHPEVLAVLDGGFAITGDAVVRLPLGPGLPFARALLQDGPMRAPAGEEADLISNVLVATENCPQLAPPLPTRPAGKPTAMLVVRMKQARPEYVMAEVQFAYGERRAEMNGPALLQPPEADGTWLLRDREGEGAELERLVAIGGEALETTGIADCFLLPRQGLGTVLFAFVTAGVRVLADGKPLRKSTSCRVQVTTGIDWFDVHGEVEFDGGAVMSLPALRAALQGGNRMIELGDGSMAMLPEEWLRQWESAFALGEEQDDGLRVRRSQAMLLDALLAVRDRDEVTLDEGFRQWRQRLQSFRGVGERPAPAGFRGRLREYQQKGLGWLWFLRELELGGCLADDMGLGKTVQVLALLQEVHGGGKGGRPSLLVAPRSLIDNWRREALRFTPELRVLDFTGADRWQRLPEDEPWQQWDLLLTTYGTLRLDVAQLEERQVQFEYAVLDEAQVASNETSLTSKAVRLLRARHRLALTGTPVQNHVGELWALFEFLNPGLLGKSRTFQKLLGGGTGSARGRGLDLELLRKALLPFLLRRTKEEVLPELPEKQEQDLVCELEAPQRKTYDALARHYRAQLLGGKGALGAKEKFAALEALLRLRQAACHEGLLDEQLGNQGSAKLDALLPKLQEVAESGHKALVFSQFTSFLAIVKARLDALDIPYEYLDGKTRNRQERVDHFQQDPDCPLFLISLKAGGFGLNLTAADYVFLLDPWWNPAAEMQAIDRAHRIGRTGKVLAYRLIAQGTVEEKVLALQAEKRELAAAVLGADQSLLAKLTREDLAELLA